MPSKTSNKSRLGDNPLDFLSIEDSEPVTTVETSKEEPAQRVMVNCRLNPALVTEAKKLARLNGDSLTAMIAEALEREIKRRRKTVAKKLQEELALMVGE